MYYESVTAILNVAASIIDDDTEDMRSTIERCYNMQDIKQAFANNGIRWATIVEEEIDLVLEGMEPIYFTHSGAYANSYRARRGIHLEELDTEGLRRTDDLADDFDARMEVRRIQKQFLGVTLFDYAFGFACPAEAKEFYESQEWQRKAKVTRYLWDYKCSFCGRSDTPLHAHHETPIVSAYHNSFEVNFSDGRLRTLCEACHRGFHQRTVRGHGRFFEFTSPDEVREEKREFKLLRAAHDMLKICPHCYGYKSGWEDAYARWVPS